MNPDGKRKIKVVALGNRTASDDGLAFKAIEELKKLNLPAEVELIEAERNPLKILEALEGCSKLIILDAVATGKAEPGTLHRITAENLKPEKPIGTHGIDGATALLIALTLSQRKPEKTVILGLEPQNLKPGQKLTPKIEEKIPSLVKETLKEILRNT